MGLDSITCHPTQVNTPALTPASQAGTRFTYPVAMEVWVDLSNWLKYLPTHSTDPPVRGW